MNLLSYVEVDGDYQTMVDYLVKNNIIRVYFYNKIDDMNYSTNGIVYLGNCITVYENGMAAVYSNQLIMNTGFYLDGKIILTN